MEEKPGEECPRSPSPSLSPHLVSADHSAAINGELHFRPPPLLGGRGGLRSPSFRHWQLFLVTRTRPGAVQGHLNRTRDASRALAPEGFTRVSGALGHTPRPNVRTTEKTYYHQK